jgi:hypothetical protein
MSFDQLDSGINKIWQKEEELLGQLDYAVNTLIADGRFSCDSGNDNLALELAGILNDEFPQATKEFGWLIPRLVSCKRHPFPLTCKLEEEWTLDNVDQALFQVNAFIDTLWAGDTLPEYYLAIVENDAGEE